MQVCKPLYAAGVVLALAAAATETQAAPDIYIDFGTSIDESSPSFNRVDTFDIGMEQPIELTNLDGALTGITMTPVAPDGFNIGTSNQQFPDTNVPQGVPQDFQRLGGTMDLQLAGTRIEFEGLQAGELYEFYLFAFTFEEDFRVATPLRITGADSVDLDFPQGEFLTINGQVPSASESIESYALSVEASAAGTVLLETLQAPSAAGQNTRLYGIALGLIPSPSAATAVALAGLLAARRRRRYMD